MANWTTGAEWYPMAKATVKTGTICIEVGDGYYEIYIDKKIQKSVDNGKSRNYTVEPGDHRVSAYSAGRMVLDETVHVPAECEAVPETNPLMDFADAIRAVKAGKRICRKGWNGKNQFIELASCLSYKNAAGEIVNAKHDAIGSQALVFVGTSGTQIGWLASQADMLANDWMLADFSEGHLTKSETEIKAEKKSE